MVIFSLMAVPTLPLPSATRRQTVECKLRERLHIVCMQAMQETCRTLFQDVYGRQRKMPQELGGDQDGGTEASIECGVHRKRELKVRPSILRTCIHVCVQFSDQLLDLNVGGCAAGKTIKFEDSRSSDLKQAWQLDSKRVAQRTLIPIMHAATWLGSPVAVDVTSKGWTASDTDKKTYPLACPVKFDPVDEGYAVNVSEP